MNISLIIVALAGTVLCQQLNSGPWVPHPGAGIWEPGPGGYGGVGGRGGFGGRGVLGDGGGRGPYPRPPLPPFTQTLSQLAQNQFHRIVTNMSLSIAEQKKQVEAWATTNKVQKQVNEFNTHVTKLKTEIKQKVKDLVNQLPQALDSFYKVLENEQQTPMQLFKAVHNLTQQNRPLYHVLMFANDQVMMQLYRNRGGNERPGGPSTTGSPLGPRGPVSPYVNPGGPEVFPGPGVTWDQRGGWGHGGMAGPGGKGGYGNVGGYRGNGRGPYPY